MMTAQIKYKIALMLFFVGVMLTNAKAQTNTNNLEICYGGLTWADIHCDSTKFAYIADKEIYLYDRINNKRYEIDSFVVFRQLPFHDLYPFYIKGNKFPMQVVNDLKYYKVGICVIIDKVYYYMNGNRKEYINDEVLFICREEFLKRKPVEYRPGVDKY